MSIKQIHNQILEATKILDKLLDNPHAPLPYYCQVGRHYVPQDVDYRVVGEQKMCLWCLDRYDGAE